MKNPGRSIWNLPECTAGDICKKQGKEVRIADFFFIFST